MVKYYGKFAKGENQCAGLVLENMEVKLNLGSRIFKSAELSVRSEDCLINSHK